MAKYMIRGEFTRILLQKQSNLTVTDFCRNKGYNRSLFYDKRLGSALQQARETGYQMKR